VINGLCIQIYNFWTGELFDSHNHGLKMVKCISWYEDDFGLITCGDGAIYSIRLKVTEKEEKENVNDKQVLFYSAVRYPEQ
jgi:hypothetical protein